MRTGNYDFELFGYEVYVGNGILSNMHEWLEFDHSFIFCDAADKSCMADVLEMKEVEMRT